MLQTTRDFLEVFKAETSWHQLNFYLNYIRNFGDREDAEALLDLYLQEPDSLFSDRLMEAIQQLGDIQTAERLFQEVVQKNLVRDRELASCYLDRYYGNVFTCLAYLGYEAIEPILYQRLEQEDHLTADDCLALLHFPCTGYEELIREKILKYKNKNLFPEYLPMLASKVPDPDLPDILYEWGTKWASTDCNGGLILGIALYGEKERDRFHNLLWDSCWEAHMGSSGSIYWTEIGLKYLGITFQELFAEIKKAYQSGCSQEDLQYRVDVLYELLKQRLRDGVMPLRFIKQPEETYEDIYHALFDQSYDESIIGWVSRKLEVQDYLYFYELEEQLLLKMEQTFWTKAFQKERLDGNMLSSKSSGIDGFQT